MCDGVAGSSTVTSWPLSVFKVSLALLTGAGFFFSSFCCCSSGTSSLLDADEELDEEADDDDADEDDEAELELEEPFFIESCEDSPMSTFFTAFCWVFLSFVFAGTGMHLSLIHI